MAGMNKAIICGRLGKDPEVKKLKELTAARLSIATSEKYKDKEETTWHTIVVYGKLAELCGQYLKKGSTALVEGRINNRSYEKDGEKKYVTEIVAASVQFLDSKPKDENKGKAEEGFNWDKA